MRAKNLVDCYALLLDIDQGYIDSGSFTEGLGAAGAPKLALSHPLVYAWTI